MKLYGHAGLDRKLQRFSEFITDVNLKPIFANWPTISRSYKADGAVIV
jgi:hypothetical protein